MYKFFRVGLILIFAFVFQTVQAAEPKLLSASSFIVEPYDGRKHGSDYTGAWVTLYNVKLDGKPFLRQSVAFEFSGNYPSKPVSSIGMSSRRTFTNMPSSAGEKQHKSLGHRFFLDPRSPSEARSRYRKLDDNDKLIMRSICGLMADKGFVNEVISQMSNAKPYSFSIYGDDKYNKYWASSKRADQAIKVAQSCNRGIGNTGSQKISFTMLNGSSSSSVSKPKPETVSQSSSCNQNRAIIRSNQTVLKDLGFYTSVIDGLSGPNYRRAVRSGEQLLGTRADDKVGCLNVPERQILSSIYDAGRKGSQCKSIMSVEEVKTTFEQLKAYELTKKPSLGYANVGGLMWMIDTVSDLEKRLSFTDFYKETKTSKRDCRLDRDEFDALAPKEPVTLSLAATTLSMTTLETDSGTTLRLTSVGNDIETSKMSKSVFGGSNQASMDVRFATFKGNPALDFVISEEDTKINLHVYESGMTNRNLEAQMPELFLDEQPNGWSAFYLRMFNDGSTNIQNGEFAKIVTQMPEKDKAMVAALCGQIGKVSSSNEGFAASFAATEDRDAFRRSSFSSEPVREAISSLANQCVDEIRSKGLVIASFDVEVQTPVCSATQNELLSKLDTEIDEAQTALQGFEDEIKAILVNRPLFERDACAAYANDLTSAQKKLSAIESEIARAITSLADLETKLAEGKDIQGSLSKISQPRDLCDVEQNSLKDRVNGFIQDLNPAAIGVVCPDDTAKSPIQIVIDEINAEITRLLEIHISLDQIAELKNTITQLEAERVEFAATLAAVSQAKASPVEIDQQMQTNAGLSDTVSEIEGQVTSLETEIFELRGVMDDNASLISEIDQLNQELVSLTSQKMLTQGTLEDVKSKVMQAKATITQVEMQIDKVRSQTSDLEVQLGAASSTAGTLQQEVQTLTLEVAQTQKRIESLEQEVAIAQDLIDNANSVIASNSQEVAKLDAELNTKTATATTLKTSVNTFAPQADAAEQTVRDLEASLKADFVPVAKYKEQEARLNEMTQIVTERTKLIRELRDDLQAIQGEEQLLVKMCLADAQCKAAMGDRLGVD
jgi:predicted  nucleic acid-binding Zn-ribbon protein